MAGNRKTISWVLLSILVVVMVVVVGGRLLKGSRTGGDAPVAGQDAAATEDSTADEAAGAEETVPYVEGEGRRVTREEYGEAWPFTVDAGAVDCVGDNAAIFRHDGTEYALNGFARSRGYEPVDPLWRDDPALPGEKVTIGPMVRLARQYCD